MKNVLQLLSVILCFALCISFTVSCTNEKEVGNIQSNLSSDIATSEILSSDEPSSDTSSDIEVSSEETSSANSSEVISSAVVSSESTSSMVSSDKVSSEVSSEKPKEPETVTAAPVVEKALGQKTAEYLLSLDKTRRGWGQGVNYDEQNRPILCTDAEKKFSKYGAEFIKKAEKKVYLTFDEGYEYQNNTASILDTLKAKNVKAVFFITLSYAKRNPELVKRMIKEGHIVGNHSATHPDYTSISLDKAYNDTMELHNYVKKNFGYEMKLFRFPSGAHSEQTMALIQKLGYKSVFWSFAYRDWETANQPEKAESLQKLTERLHPGALYLLHAVSNTNTAILGDFIDNIRKAGYDISIEY